jgi:hypothetical protein
MQLEDLYREFQGLDSIYEKIEWLQEMSRINLPYDINWDGLIRAWEALLG